MFVFVFVADISICINVYIYGNFKIDLLLEVAWQCKLAKESLFRLANHRPILFVCDKKFPLYCRSFSSNFCNYFIFSFLN